ncbi:cob(I)yrinic acid a,c-diamide adenosyltransferase [Ammoniphilus sp. 3BR4]|uniref:cob(I)yrinic acid a,c-diamide adenosyltransferase n=1 Tax=Ammoniphilus sp. 3BR4 TaxID=3158265 RepID=UPI0034673321
MKIYTKSGDKGETSLVYGQRVSKQSPRVEAYGTCDEANSMIGLALSFLPQEERWNEFHQILHTVQTKLFHVGAELATPQGKEVGWKIAEEDVCFLEEQIDQWDAKLPLLANFILPGGHPTGSALHVARTMVRRAERTAVEIQKDEDMSKVVLQYLNRLSDFLFVAARYINHLMGSREATLHQE